MIRLDFPEKWPSLLPELLAGLQSGDAGVKHAAALGFLEVGR